MLVSDLPDDALNVFITLNARGLNGSFIIVALCRQNGTLIKNPQSGTILEVGDRVIVMGHQGDIPRFARTNELKSKMRYRGSSIG